MCRKYCYTFYDLRLFTKVMIMRVVMGRNMLFFLSFFYPLLASLSKMDQKRKGWFHFHLIYTINYKRDTKALGEYTTHLHMLLYQHLSLL